MLSVNVIEWNSNEDWTRQITLFLHTSLAETYMIVSAADTYDHRTLYHIFYMSNNVNEGYE